MEQDLYSFFLNCFPSDGSEDVRRQRMLDIIKASQHVPMTSEVEEGIKQTIENPYLLIAEDVRVHRDHIRENGHFFDQPELPKCSVLAAKRRADGNRSYAEKAYEQALQHYNASICSAPNDSEDLGIGYANRSAVFYNLGKYSLALANITLAKQHNYPERLMSKLVVREASCKQALDKRNSVTPSSSYLTSFISDKVCVQKIPIYNNGLVAKQNIKAGDVILQEKPLIVAIDAALIFIKCNHCSSENLCHLIPCPNCISAMFCDEECLQRGQTIHRFECNYSGQISKLKDACLASRMFFHGLSLFDNNVNKMMSFCTTVQRTDNTFLDMDYSNYDPLKEFEIFLSVKPGENGISLLGCSMRYCAAVIHDILLKVPAVQAVITNNEQEDFMLQCIAEYFPKTTTMSMQRGSSGALYPFASLCNHSCTPNVLAIDFGGKQTLVALRPIRRDSQIFVSYGAHYDDRQNPSKREHDLTALTFRCICDVCDEQKHQKLKKRAKKCTAKNAITERDWYTINSLMMDTRLNKTDRKNALQQFIQRYGLFHPLEIIVTAYSILLFNKYAFEINAAIEAKMAD